MRIEYLLYGGIDTEPRFEHIPGMVSASSCWVGSRARYIIVEYLHRGAVGMRPVHRVMAQKVCIQWVGAMCLSIVDALLEFNEIRNTPSVLSNNGENKRVSHYRGVVEQFASVRTARPLGRVREVQCIAGLVD